MRSVEQALLCGSSTAVEHLVFVVVVVALTEYEPAVAVEIVRLRDYAVGENFVVTPRRCFLSTPRDQKRMWDLKKHFFV